MDKNRQYAYLLEIVANARMLAANSDNNEVIDSAEKIKKLGVQSATALGFSDAKFTSDTIVLYKGLMNKYNNDTK